MKTCSFCNTSLDDDAVFCTNCGQKVETAAQPVVVEYQQPQPQQAYQQPSQPYQPQPYQPNYQQTQNNFNAGAQNINVSINMGGGCSQFDGGLLQQIGWSLLAILVTLCTCGIAFPWAYCMLLRWQVKHTVIDGRRLVFDGTGGQLFGNWIIWTLLTIITCGIYSFWLGIKLKQWEVSHTHFAN